LICARIIPVLLLRRNGLVKTIKFDKAKYIGDPINAVKIFNDKEVDELVFLDIDASKEGRGPDFELIENIAAECFMPLGYGGGISTLEEIQRLFSIGVEKVILNSSALTNLQLISDASQIFGDQSIVVSIDVTKTFLGSYQVFSHSKQKHNWSDVVSFATAAVQAGAGEIFINAVERDGTMSGYDLKIIEKVSHSTNVPVVACGGAGSIDDFRKALSAGASAVAAGSLFIFHGPHKAVLINYPSELQMEMFGTKT
jgi:imidazole glycerol-phosphate synthase subunit HisF